MPRNHRAAALSILALVVMAPVARGEIIGVSFAFLNSPVVRIDSTTGTGSVIGNSGFSALNSLAQNSSGALYSAVDNPSVFTPDLITINPDSGAGAKVATLNFGAVVPDVRGLAFSPADVLFAANNTGPVGMANPDDLFRVDLATGIGTLIGPTGLRGVQSITFAPSGILYGWDVGGGTGFPSAGLVTIDPTTGVATDVNLAVGDGGLFIQGIAFSPDGKLFGVSGTAAAVMPDTLFTIDPVTGIAAPVGSGGYADVRGIAFQPIPEPSAVILLGLASIGLLGYACLRRR